jgi:predicted nucleic acid-binding protein
LADFDFDDAIRWSRFDPKRTLSRRKDRDLPFLREEGLGGPPILLDTCVYIDQMQGRTPPIVERLIATRQTNHSTVAIQELMHSVGVLNSKDPRTVLAIAEIRRQINSMRPHRVFAPEPDVLGKAALLSGILCRLQGFAADYRLRALQDCVLFLQAQKLGFTVITANLSEFDYLLQLIPAGRALFYRQM